MSIDILKDQLPEYARDLKLNLSSLASEQLLSPQQKAGSFIAARSRRTTRRPHKPWSTPSAPSSHPKR